MLLIFLFSSANHGPHSKKAFICHIKPGPGVLNILVDSSGELPDQKKTNNKQNFKYCRIVGFLSISTSRVAVLFCQLVWPNRIPSCCSSGLKKVVFKFNG